MNIFPQISQMNTGFYFLRKSAKSAGELTSGINTDFHFIKNCKLQENPVNEAKRKAYDKQARFYENHYHWWWRRIRLGKP